MASIELGLGPALIADASDQVAWRPIAQVDIPIRRSATKTTSRSTAVIA
ncbi:hypothetical protein AiwAL_13520 [Acidiphilium sp. AL]|nr:hypothetical protein [Acidiphilium sp. AL]